MVCTEDGLNRLRHVVNAPVELHVISMDSESKDKN